MKRLKRLLSLLIVLTNCGNVLPEHPPRYGVSIKPMHYHARVYESVKDILSNNIEHDHFISGQQSKPPPYSKNSENFEVSRISPYSPITTYLRISSDALSKSISSFAATIYFLLMSISSIVAFWVSLVSNTFIGSNKNIGPDKQTLIDRQVGLLGAGAGFGGVFAVGAVGAGLATHPGIQETLASAISEAELPGPLSVIQDYVAATIRGSGIEIVTYPLTITYTITQSQ